MGKKDDEAEHSHASGGMYQLDDGHWVLGNAVRHTPRLGSPTECEIDGCEKVLGAWRNHDPIAVMSPEQDNDPAEQDPSLDPGQPTGTDSEEAA